MTFTLLYGTGFEMGRSPFVDSGDSTVSNNNAVTTSYKKTGSYGLAIYCNENNWIRVPINETEIYTSVWIYSDGGNTSRMQYYLTDGKIIDVRYDGTYFDAYVDNVKVADGTISFGNNAWHNLQVYIKIADSGNIQTKIDGRADITYAGDTKPSAATNMNYVRFYATGQSSANWDYLDDFAVATGGWIGEVRFEKLTPDADITKEFSVTGSATNFGAIDEVPPSDADYVYTQTTGVKDIYGLSDITITNKVPMALVHWVRGKTDSTSSFKFLASDTASGIVVGNTQALTAAYAYYDEIYMTDPTTTSGGSGDLINSFRVGQEAVIA